MDRFILINVADTVVPHIGFYDNVDQAREHAANIKKFNPGADLKLWQGPDESNWNDSGVTLLPIVAL